MNTSGSKRLQLYDYTLIVLQYKENAEHTVQLILLHIEHQPQQPTRKKDFIGPS